MPVCAAGNIVGGRRAGAARSSSISDAGRAMDESCPARSKHASASSMVRRSLSQAGGCHGTSDQRIAVPVFARERGVGFAIPPREELGGECVDGRGIGRIGDGLPPVAGVRAGWCDGKAGTLRKRRIHPPIDCKVRVLRRVHLLQEVPGDGLEEVCALPAGRWRSHG